MYIFSVPLFLFFLFIPISYVNIDENRKCINIRNIHHRCLNYINKLSFRNITVYDIKYHECDNSSLSEAVKTVLHNFYGHTSIAELELLPVNKS